MFQLFYFFFFSFSFHLSCFVNAEVYSAKYFYQNSGFWLLHFVLDTGYVQVIVQVANKCLILVISMKEFYKYPKHFNFQ